MVQLWPAYTAYYQTKNIFSSPGLEEPSGWEPIPEQPEKHSLLLKTSLSDFLSHCGWTSPAPPPLTTTTPSCPESTEPRVYGFTGSSGVGCFWAIAEYQFVLSVGRKIEWKVNSKRRGDVWKSSGPPGLATPQTRAHWRRGVCLWMTTKAFLYPAKKQILGFTFQSPHAGWVLAPPRAFWMPLEGQASGPGARRSGGCSADGCPASCTCCTSR